jgi:hypothetical protein
MNELKQLLPLAIAQVEKANTHVDWVIDGLCHASQSKWQAFDAEFNLHATKNAYGKTSIRANVAPARADVDDSTLYVGRQID